MMNIFDVTFVIKLSYPVCRNELAAHFLAILNVFIESNNIQKCNMWPVRLKSHIVCIKIFSCSRKHDFTAHTKFHLKKFLISKLNYVE